MKSNSSHERRYRNFLPNIGLELKSIIFEFILVFFAVFLGFWADRWREKIFERERERQFMSSMYQDLKSDTSDITLNINKSKKVITGMHKVISLMNSANRYDSALNIYHYARSITLNSPDYEPNQRTYEQMKYSGELRLIRDKSVADSVTGYYSSLAWILTQNTYIHDRTSDYMAGAENIFDGNVFLLILEDVPDSVLLKALPKDKFLSTEKLAFNKFFIRTQYFSGACRVTIPAAGDALRKCKNLMMVLKEKYHLKE